MRSLIINADDFGFTRDVNAGIVEAYQDGVLTSTTLMATGDAFEDAVALAHENPGLGVGAHLVLVQGRSLLNGRQLPAGPRQLLAELVRGSIDVHAELRLQIQKLLEAGIVPTHLDTHKHTHVTPQVFREVVRLAEEFGIRYVRLPPAGFWRRYYRRAAGRCGVRLADHFRGFKLTGCLTETTFCQALDELPEGLTEFMCHPGQLGEELRAAPTRLKEARVRELEALLSPRVRQKLDGDGVVLRSYRE